MKIKREDIEASIEDAIVDAQAQGPGKINVARLAKMHAEPERRLRRRPAGCNSKSTRTPANKKLSDTQEKAILAWIRTLDDLGLAARPASIRTSADQLLRLAYSTSGTPAPTVERIG
ncbi:hypothetical protein OC861_006980, partial [Tilletia horrida]